MTNKSMLAEPCCDRCTHGADKPCPKMVECLIDGPLCHDDPACRAGRQERAAAVRRDQGGDIRFIVGAGTCGLGAGAAKTMEAVKAYCAERSLSYSMVETGCIGYCAAEPIVDVILPGRPRVSFASVTRSGSRRCWTGCRPESLTPPPPSATTPARGSRRGRGSSPSANTRSSRPRSGSSFRTAASSTRRASTSTSAAAATGPCRRCCAP